MSKGALSLTSSFQITGTAYSPYGVVASPNNKNLYVICNGNSSSSYAGSGVVQLSIDQTTGALSQIASKPLFMATTSAPRRATIPPDGKNLYVAVSGYSDLYNFTIDAVDGSLTQQTKIGFASATVPIDISASYDNAHVYVACNSGAGGNMLRAYRRDMASNGNLVEIQQVTLTGAHAVKVSKDGSAVFAASSTTNTLYWYSRNTDSASVDFGKLTLVTSIVTPSNWPSAIEITDDGNFIYTADDSGNQYTGCFQRNTSNNTLTDLGHPALTSDSNGGPWAIALSKDTGNTSLYVALSDVQKISQYDRSSSVLTTGGLKFKTPGSVTTSNWVSGTPSGSGGPYGLAVTENNKFLYATALKTNTVDVFTIEPDPVTVQEITGGSTGSGVASGALILDAKLAGSSTGVATTDASLVLNRMIAGTANGTSTGSALFTYIVPALKSNSKLAITLINHNPYTVEYIPIE